MLTAPPYINPGEELSATYMRRLVRYIRSITPIQGPNILLSRGPNGTVITGTPGGKKSVEQSKDVGRFAITSKTDPEHPDDPPTTVMTNCYYDVGGKTYKMEDQPVPTVSEDEPEVFVALHVNATGTSVGGTVAKYDTFEEMQEAQSDRKYYITPLYRLDADGNVLVDFRIGPAASQGEF